MNRYISHGLWCGLVILAYVIGSMASPVRQQVAREGDTDSARIATLLPPQKAHRLNPSEDSNKGTIADLLGKRRSLSDDAIAILGQRFKDARNPTEGRLAYARLLEGLSIENALMIREQLLHLDEKSTEFREFHYAWGEIADKKAVLHGAETPERDLAVTLAGWARANPQEAKTWVESVRDSERFNQADLEYGIAHGLALTDPEAAGAYLAAIAENGDSDHTGKALGMVLGKLIQADGYAQTAAWAQSLSDNSAIKGMALHPC